MCRIAIGLSTIMTGMGQVEMGGGGALTYLDNLGGSIKCLKVHNGMGA